MKKITIVTLVFLLSLVGYLWTSNYLFDSREKIATEHIELLEEAVVVIDEFEKGKSFEDVIKEFDELGRMFLELQERRRRIDDFNVYGEQDSQLRRLSDQLLEKRGLLENSTLDGASEVLKAFDELSDL